MLDLIGIGCCGIDENGLSGGKRGNRQNLTETDSDYRDWSTVKPIHHPLVRRLFGTYN